MAYYRTCPACKAALDPQERCDCQDYHQTGRKEMAAAFSSPNHRGTQRNTRSSWEKLVIYRGHKSQR